MKNDNKIQQIKKNKKLFTTKEALLPNAMKKDKISSSSSTLSEKITLGI